MNLTPPLRSVRLLFRNTFFKSYSRASGAPRVGENREAGEIPARSRHCDALEATGYQATDPGSGRLPAAKMCGQL